MTRTGPFSADAAKGWIPWALLAPIIGLAMVILPVLATDGLLQSWGSVDARGNPIGLNGLIVFLTIPFGLMALLNLAWVWLVERRPLANIGLPRAPAVKSFARGLGLGVLTILSVIVSILLFGGYEIGQIAPALRSPQGLLGIALLIPSFILQASSEELLFRGWLMSALGRKLNLALAAAISSALFSLVHYGPGQPWLVTLGTFLFGLFTACWAIKAGNIWGVMGWHSAWNWLLAVGFELPVTGLDAHTPALLVKLTPIGSDLLTGGAQGPEGSVFCVVFLAIWSAVLIWRYLRARQRPAD